MNMVIHIGFPKTGTTTQQKHLFAKHSQINYLGKPYQDSFLESVIHDLIREDSLIYGSRGLRDYLSGRLLSSKKQGTLSFISDELFVSATKTRDKGVVAQRLKEVFFPCRILITIRNQLDILKSAYLSGGRLLGNAPRQLSGYTITFNDWLEISHRNLKRSYVGNVNYYPLIKYYSDLFGKENVCVLLYEDLQNNQRKYLYDLTGFLRIDLEESVKLLKSKHENIRIKQSTLDYERLKTQFYPVSRLPIGSKLLKSLSRLKIHTQKDRDADVNFCPEWRERLYNYYQEGNRNLIKEFKLPLEKHNYPV